MAKMERHKFVWAKNRMEFKILCGKMGWTEGDAVLYIGSRMHLLGKRDIDIIRHGRVWERPGFTEEQDEIDHMHRAGDVQLFGTTYNNGNTGLIELHPTLGPGFGK